MGWVPPELIKIPKNTNLETRKKFFDLYLGTFPEKIKIKHRYKTKMKELHDHRP